MATEPVTRDPSDPQSTAIYRRALDTLLAARIPFLVGGAYALSRYTGIERDTKDLDVFVRPEDSRQVLDRLAAAGFKTELTFPHWLGKAYQGDRFIDVIFSSGNAVVRVDDAWFERGVDMEVLGSSVRICPVEEMIWSKSFVMERERYDGADIAHLLRAQGDHLDWQHLVARFGRHWRVLLNHLVLFGFIYPSEQTKVPESIVLELLDRAAREARSPTTDERICRGTLLSRSQYLVDIDDWGYRDARLPPSGSMSRADIAHWTAAISK
jgi:hypothetical protein